MSHNVSVCKHYFGFAAGKDGDNIHIERQENISELFVISWFCIFVPANSYHLHCSPHIPFVLLWLHCPITTPHLPIHAPDLPYHSVLDCLLFNALAPCSHALFAVLLFGDMFASQSW